MILTDLFNAIKNCGRKFHFIDTLMIYKQYFLFENKILHAVIVCCLVMCFTPILIANYIKYTVYILMDKQHSEFKKLLPTFYYYKVYFHKFQEINNMVFLYRYEQAPWCCKNICLFNNRFFWKHR